jgi:DNA primase large subunit
MRKLTQEETEMEADAALDIQYQNVRRKAIIDQFIDLPDEEYIERIGDVIDELMKEGKLSYSVMFETDELTENLPEIIALAEKKYKEEKGIKQNAKLV